MLRHNIGDLTRSSMAVKRQKGEATSGTAPFGARIVEGLLVPDEAAVAAYHEAVKLRAKGWELAVICDELLEEFGVRVSTKTLSRVLREGLPRYAEGLQSDNNTDDCRADNINRAIFLCDRLLIARPTEDISDAELSDFIEMLEYMNKFGK